MNPRLSPPKAVAGWTAWLRESAGDRRLFRLLVPGLLLALVVGCGPRRADVVVYAAQDRVYAEPLLQAFEQETGLRVAALYDSEAVKTVGLANRLLAERSHPVADVFWGNEEFRTRQLAAEGIFRATNGWSAFGWRSRRVIVNTNQVSLSDVPPSLLALTNEVWRGKVALAYPIFGTTATHFAALRQHWGTETWAAWARGLVANDAFVLDGNSVVARMVARGEAWIGLTDSDDIRVVQAEGAPVAMLPLGPETLLIPNTVAIVADAPHAAAAERLGHFLLGDDVARRLVEVGALEGTGLTELAPQTLQPDWDRLLAELDDTTQRLCSIFLR